MLDTLWFLGICGLACWLHYLHREARTASFRHELFVLRRELFDYAAAGHIAFKHPAYRIARERTNNLIRFGHRLNLLYVFLLSQEVDFNPDVLRDNWEDTLATVEDDDVYEAMMHFHVRRLQLLANHVLRDPFALPLRTAFRVAHLIGSTGSRISFRLRVLPEIDAMSVDDEGHLMETLTPSGRRLSLAS